MDPQPTLSAGAFAEIGPAIRTVELDFEDLLRRVDISEDELADWDNPISLNAVSELFELAAIAKNDDALSLELAQRFPARGTGVLGYVLLNAPTLRQSLLDFGRYSRLVAPDIETTLTEDGTGGTLEWRFPDHFLKPRDQFVAFVTATLIVRIRLVTGGDWMPDQSSLEIDAPANIEAYRRVFGKNVHFESARTYLKIKTETLDLPMPDADVRLHKLIQELGEYRLVELEAASDIVDRTQDQIILLLNHGPVSLEMVA
ncbi:MAG: AraC family transcriptional regulator, partial [Methyloligellaceae bacterium]